MKFHPPLINLLAHSCLFILALLLPTTAAAAAATQITNLTTPSNADLTCYPLRTQAFNLGRLQNCAAAILALPSNSQPMTFHVDQPDDLGRLPQSRDYGDCTVTVLSVGPNDVGTWTDIRLAGSLLMNACTDFQFTAPYTGGFASAGNGGRIRVFLQRSQVGNGAGNGRDFLRAIAPLVTTGFPAL